MNTVESKELEPIALIPIFFGKHVKKICASFEEGFYAFAKEGFVPSCSDEAELTNEAYLTRAKPKLTWPI